MNSDSENILGLGLGPQWLDLPSTLWTLVFDRLDLLDCLRFGATCPLFHAISTQKQPHHLSSPLLLLPPASKTSPHLRHFYSLKDSQLYPTHLPQLHNKLCYGSSFGYLFAADFSSGEIFLLNPLSKSKILLPPLSAFPELEELGDDQPDKNHECFIQKATISCNPSNNNKECIVMTILTHEWIPAFCRPGDERWTVLSRIQGPVEDIIFRKGKFYAITSYGALVTWDFSDGVPKGTVVMPDEGPELSGFSLGRRYLVESIREELYLVYRAITNKMKKDRDLYKGEDENEDGRGTDNAVGDSNDIREENASNNEENNAIENGKDTEEGNEGNNEEDNAIGNADEIEDENASNNEENNAIEDANDSNRGNAANNEADNNEKNIAVANANDTGEGNARNNEENNAIGNANGTEEGNTSNNEGETENVTDIEEQQAGDHGNGNARDSEEGDADSGYYRTGAIMVVKLEEEKKDWITVCLCDQAMFLGYNRGFCVPVKEHPELKNHSVYFTDDYRECFYDNPFGCNDVGFYNVKERIDTQHFFENPPFWTEPCFWVTPNLH